MKPERWIKVETICMKALPMQGEKRTAYLENACAGDPELLKTVTGLLEQEEGEFLREPLTLVKSSNIFSDDDSVSDQIIGPYRVIKTIASGGMGQVYLAVRDDDQFERFVALKVIRKGMVSDDVLERFYEERQILASLNHPQIARLFDGGTTADGMPWFAMEYIEGQPVTEYCKANDLGLRKKIDLLLKIFSAVQYAHRNLIIHRDLKPANILITPDGMPKLLDFGIAKLMDMEQQAGLTQYHQRLLTPEYASPEQVRNEPVTTVSDVYALGVLMYELLTGVLPYEFEKRTAAGIEETICNEIPKRPSAVSGLKILKGDLDSVMLKALKKDPAERYTSVEQFANDLKRFQKGLPVSAQKDSFTYRTGKFLHRNKWAASVAAAVALLIIAFGAVTFMQSKAIEARAVVAERQRDRAEEVSNFLIGLFESVDPSKAEDINLTAIELLHRGAVRIDAELEGRPDLQAEMYLVIADVYDKLGLYDEGLDMANKAYIVLEKHDQTEDSLLAQSLNVRGWLNYELENYEKADSLMAAAVTMQRALFGNMNLDLSRYLNDLEVLKARMGDYEAADTLIREALKIRRALLGDVHRSVAVSLHNYANLVANKGDIKRALKMEEEAVKIFVKTEGEYHLKTAFAIGTLAIYNHELRNMDEAENLYRRALKIRLKLLGEEHPMVARSYSLLGNFLKFKKEYDEAERLLTKALQLRKKLLGSNNIPVARSYGKLGNLSIETGEYEKAVNYLKDALAIYRSKLPAVHAETASTLHSLGLSNMNRNKYDKAALYFQEALDMRKQIFGVNHFKTAFSMIKLGECLAEKGEATEAKSILSAGLEALDNSNRDSEELRLLAEKTLAEL